MSDLHIRWMIRSDMPAVATIDRDSFEDPWTVPEFLNCLRQRNTIGLVAEDGDRHVAGFVIYQIHTHRLEIINLAVDPVLRDAGVGTAMIAKLRSKLGQRRPVIDVLVRETNLDAQLFFKKRGFTCTSISRDHWGTGESGYWFEADCKCQDSLRVTTSRMAGFLKRGARWSV